MNDQSQIEAKIIHLTPPQRFQVAHQLPKERPAEPNPICPTPKNNGFKAVTTNHSKIWAILILNGTWLLVTLFLKRCTRIDKNLLVVYVALVLLLLQVFMVISRAEAGSLNRPPLITSPSYLSADWQHMRIANTFTLSNNRRSTLSAHFIGRSSVTQPESRPWPVRFAGICPRTNVPALGAAAAFWFFFAAEKELGHAPAMRGSKKSQRIENPITVSLIMSRGSENGYHSSLLPFAETQVIIGSCDLLTESRLNLNRLGPCGYEHSINFYKVFRQQSAYPTLSGPGVPQMITSTVPLT